MVKYISRFVKILFCAMMLCHNSGLLAMQAEDFLYDPVSLLGDNQHLLVEWINKEAQGTFCPELRAATKALSKMFLDAKENEDMFAGDSFSQESLDRARYVVEAKKNKKDLHNACWESDVNAIMKVVEKSPYSIHGYNYKSCFARRDYYPILYEAVTMNSSLDVIKTLLKLGSCVNGKTSKWGYSALHGVKNKETAKLLISHGAHINEKDFYGRNPIWQLICGQFSSKINHNYCLINYFLKHGADVHCHNVNGISLMHHVLNVKNFHSKRVNSAILKLLLDYASRDQRWNSSRAGVVLPCIVSNNTYWFKFANIQYIPFCSNPYGCTIIDYIANRGKMLKAMTQYFKPPVYQHDRRIYDVAKFFLRLKNVKEQTENDGVRIIFTGYSFENASYDDLAQIIGKDSVEASQKYILEYCQKISHNIESAPNKYAYFFVFGYDEDIAFQGAKRMMERNAIWFSKKNMPYCLDQTDKNGNTLLHLSVEPHRSLGAISWLMNNGIDFTAKNNDGLTAFDLADKMEDKTILLCLIKSVQEFFSQQRGYQYLKTYKDFWNTFFVYVSRDPKESLTWLHILFNSGKITQSFKCGWVEQLLTDQVPINEVDRFKCSLLDYAIRDAEHKEVVELLLFYGALVKKSMKTNVVSDLKSTLKKAYKSQLCSLCCEHSRKMISIPCPHYHSKKYICQKCYKNLLIKKCPLCLSDLLPHRWEFS